MENETTISPTIARPFHGIHSGFFCKTKDDDRSKDKQKVTKLKRGCALFSHLYIARYTKEGDIQEGFNDETQKSLF